jgi:hypothetical protein
MKNDFLDLENMTAFDGDVFDATPVQQAQPVQQQQQQQFYAQPQPVQQAQPNPIAQLNQQQAKATLDTFVQNFQAEAGKGQARAWRGTQKAAATLPGLLMKLAKVGALGVFVAHGDLLIEPLVHRPIAQHIITSAKVGDGTAAIFNADQSFAEQHWALQLKTNIAVNTLMAAVWVMLFVFWEPATDDEADLKRKTLIWLAILAAPVVLF